MEIKIKQVIYNDLSLKVTYCKIAQTAAGDVSDDITIKGGGLAHEDFTKALDQLKVHFAALCDFREVPQTAGLTDGDMDYFLEKSDLEHIFVTGLKLSGSYESEKAEIIGGKMVDGKVVSLTSPKAKAGSDTYPFKDQLFEIIELIKYETNEYLFKAKYAIKQESFQFDDDVDNYDASVYEDSVMSELSSESSENIS